MNQRRMTIGQLYMAVGKDDRISLRSLYDISTEAELTMELLGYSGIMSLEVCHLSHHGETYIADVDLPAAAIAAMDEQDPE